MTQISALLLLFVFSMPPFANSSKRCESVPVKDSNSWLDDNMMEIKEVLDKSSADSTQKMRNASCRSIPLTEDEINSYFNSFKSTSNGNVISVSGVTFENESKKLIQMFNELVTKYTYWGKPMETIDVQKKYSINPKCKKVICAIKKIFGKTLGPKLLYMKTRYGFNSSHLSYDVASPLNDRELERILIGIRNFPPSTFPLKHTRSPKTTGNKQLIRIRGPSRRGIIANATMKYFDPWEQQSDPYMDIAVVHELGHYIWAEKKLSSLTWNAFSGWVNKGSKWEYTKKHTLTSDYATNGPEEDFAESVVEYRYDPIALKKASLEKYNFIKNKVFNDIEYEDRCPYLAENEANDADQGTTEGKKYIIRIIFQ